MADRQVFIDVAGLAPALSRAQQERYVEALGLEGSRLHTESERLQTLARLRAGAGVTVLTGPQAAPFWSLASLEVKVRVVPDDIEAETGVTDPVVWSLRAVGVLKAAAEKAATGYSVDRPPRGALRPQWDEAAALLARMNQHASAGAVAIVVEQFHTEAVTDPAEQLQLLDNIHEFTSLDWEWDPTIPGRDPAGLSVSTKDRTWYLALEASDFNLPKLHGKALRKAAVEFMQRQSTVFHNAKADMQTQYEGDPLDLHGSTKPVHDTLIMAYLLSKGDLRLKKRAREELGRDPLEYPGLIRDLPVGLGSRYAGADTRNTFDLYELYEKELKADGQWDVYDKLERPIVPIVASMERFGTPMDPVEVQRNRDDLWASERRYHDAILDEYGFDIDKKEQRRDYLAQRLGWRPGSLSKTALSKVHTDWMTDDLAFAQERTQRTSFPERHLEKWNEAGRPEVITAFTDFNQAGASLYGDPRGFKLAPRTGRFSSASPKDDPFRIGYGNLQNQPRGQRAAFIGGPCIDHGLQGLRSETICCDQMPLFWSFDYSGLELHIAASRSRDPLMLATLLAGGDLHQAFLDNIIRLTSVNVGRPVAKQGNFEQLYGGGADKLMQILAIQRAFISYDVAKSVVQAHHETFKGYHGYTAGVIEEARMNGGNAYTLMGRRRNEARDLFGRDPDRRGWAERALVNMTIQGTAADILKQAMDWCVPVLREFGAHLNMQIHDELCGVVPAGNAAPFKAAMTALMGAVPLPGLKLHVEGGPGLTWALAK